MTTILRAAAATFLLTGLAVEASADGIRLIPQPDLVWEVTPEGVAFAALKGNRFLESYMAMVRLPAGLVSPIHVKSAGMFGLIVSGEMVHVTGNVAPAQEQVLKAGDYYEIPAGLAHLSKCVSTTECVTFLYQDGAFDFVPVGETRP
ncbi:cupin domain-containing protein [Roseibium sediminicola]|uniref:Cupin domain-containing protein n=1 Tax=Roseibium sediminicola TaxID=2933272 RepID=A0ABT0GRQ1_9HYPH|nr:cupin domain-containing protein [Roseibium sp. CAU 1639]MCK7612125.1 cupin domain-containing protein [Roseibium sp. CAU 1639]